MTGEFEGLASVITGGASGIGAAIAVRLLDAGCRVAVLDLDTTNADPRTTAISADVGDDQSVRTAIATATDALGGLDVLVNNAGIGAVGAIDAFDTNQWQRVLNVNVLGIARVSAAAMPYLRLSHAGTIVNTCSVAAAVGLPQRALYSASKGAVLALTRAMAADCLAEGIRVNSVSPGTADTPWITRLLDSATDPQAERASLEGRQPHGRLVTADEVAEAVAYLASPRNRSTTGENINVDGGLTTLRPPR